MDQIAELQDYLRHGAHSFRSIRKRTALALSDDEFRGLISQHPDKFRTTNIIKRDEEGHRVRPGNPGMALIQPIAS